MISLAQRVNGIRFDGLHSFYDFGMWLAERPDYGTPNPKTHITQVPGMDGALDLTEANSGEVKYTNRTIRFTFAKMVELDKQEEFKSIVRNALHGKYIQQIIPDEAPDWYYSGRVNVDFTNLASWKLRCVITIDAAPYALKLQKTYVDLLSGFAEVQDVQIAAQDVSMQDWNTDLRFGTKEFPAGLGSAGLGDFEILKFPPNFGTFPGAPRKFQVVDSENHVYTSGNISDYAIEAGEINIDVSTLTAAGIVLSNVYRLLAMNMGQCSLHINKLGIRVRMWNERKTVVPTIVWQTNNNPGGEEYLSELEIIVNGEARTINNKRYEYEDIVLQQGWNDILIPMDYMSLDTVSLNMIYREGRL